MFHSLLDLTVDIFGGSIDPEAGAELATGISSTSAGGPGEAISPQTERVGKGLRRCQFPEQFGSSEQGGFDCPRFRRGALPLGLRGRRSAPRGSAPWMAGGRGCRLWMEVGTI